ncbi:MAG: ABC transporter substrate-binding protein, partial [Bosea sp. (in: a-proteobacteria)]|nr:ABC transporter substrate-binding protein [Bosea sp. (in: a-proteobacteria)]
MTERFPLSRRSFLATAGATALISAPALAQTANKPLKIGMVTSLSGPFTALGESMRAGMQMFLAENGGRLAGRAVEL